MKMDKKGTERKKEWKKNEKWKMKYCDVYKETEGEIGSARSGKEQQNITNKRGEIRENFNNLFSFLFLCQNNKTNVSKKKSEKNNVWCNIWLFASSAETGLNYFLRQGLVVLFPLPLFALIIWRRNFLLWLLFLLLLLVFCISCHCQSPNLLFVCLFFWYWLFIILPGKNKNQQQQEKRKNS